MNLPEKYIVVDFETKDPYISRGYGAGWTFALNHDKEDFKVLGMGVYDSETEESKYITCPRQMRDELANAKHIVCHNATYDLGCILVLMKGMPFDLSQYTVYDTLVMTKLYRQDLMRYGLEAVCTFFNLDYKKQGEVLAGYAWECGLYQQLRSAETGRQVHTRPTDNLILKEVMKNLDLVDQELVAEYCIADILATNSLFEFVADKLDSYDIELFSDLAKIVVDIRKNGVRIDLNQARKVSKELKDKEDLILTEIKNEFDLDLNINSPYQLGNFLEHLGITNYPRTEKGNPSVSTDYLESLEHEWAQRVAEARIANKIRGSFVDKMIEYQGFDNNINGDIGVMYTSLNILGATRTGRFTSGGGGVKSFELNIQQIPSTNSELGKLCRSMFLPNEGETWVSADFSNQEPRIQVHYALKLDCEGAEDIATSWSLEPETSFHDKVSEFTGLPKKEAKVINLGLSYGMGEAKLCQNLGLPTQPKTIFNGKVIQVAGPEGKAVLKQYHQLVPFMNQLIDKTNTYFRKNGYVRTLGGRKLKINPYFEGDWRKGLSKIVQGSAADQTMRALVECHRKGLHIINTVHDEINISSSKPEEDATILKDCMENAIPIDVPMVAEIAVGKDWAEAK